MPTGPAPMINRCFDCDSISKMVSFVSGGSEKLPVLGRLPVAMMKKRDASWRERPLVSWISMQCGSWNLAVPQNQFDSQLFDVSGSIGILIHTLASLSNVSHDLREIDLGPYASEPETVCCSEQMR